MNAWPITVAATAPPSPKPAETSRAPVTRRSAPPPKNVATATGAKRSSPSSAPCRTAATTARAIQTAMPRSAKGDFRFKKPSISGETATTAAIAPAPQNIAFTVNLRSEIRSLPARETTACVTASCTAPSGTASTEIMFRTALSAPYCDGPSRRLIRTWKRKLNPLTPVVATTRDQPPWLSSPETMRPRRLRRWRPGLPRCFPADRAPSLRTRPVPLVPSRSSRRAPEHAGTTPSLLGGLGCQVKTGELASA